MTVSSLLLMDVLDREQNLKDSDLKFLLKYEQHNKICSKLTVLFVPLLRNLKTISPCNLPCCICCFSGVSKGPSMPLEPEPDVDNAPSPPTDPLGSPDPSESAKPRTTKKKSKVEAWKIVVATIWKSFSGLVVFLLRTQSPKCPGFWFLWPVPERCVESETQLSQRFLHSIYFRNTEWRRITLQFFLHQNT